MIVDFIAELFTKVTLDAIIKYSGFISSVATVVAIYSVKNWRKQQMYAEKVNSLIEMEASFELLFAEYGALIRDAIHLSEAALNGVKKSDILNAQKESLAMIKVAEYSRKYEISYLKCNRINYLNIKNPFLKIKDIEAFYSKNLGFIE